MNIEIYQKKTWYELLITRSLPTPESSVHLKATNAYYYYCYLDQSQKTNAAQKQFMELKKYLAKAMERLKKRMRGAADKQSLTGLIASLDFVFSLSQIDEIIQQALEITRPLIKKEYSNACS